MLKLLLFLLFPVSVFAQVIEFKGKAVSIDPKGFDYQEVHSIERDSRGYDKKISTKYLDSKGEVFAQMTADFSKNDFAPDLKFEDFRSGDIEQLVTLQGEKKVKFTRANSKKSYASESTAEWRDNLIAGQGFNNFIRANFEKLKQGESIEIFFVVLARQDFYRFDIKRRSISATTMEIEVSLHNFFLKRFVKELKLTYSLADRRLIKFIGLSNLNDDKARNPLVDISYE